MESLSAREGLIRFRACSIGSALSPALTGISWELKPGEAWVVTGPNGGGKSAFAAALAAAIPVVPAPGGECLNAFAGKAALVSFEAAAAVIERERANDDSDFVEGGVDPGTPVRRFIAGVLPATKALRYPEGEDLESHPAILSCGIGPILDRGLKRLSTGEIRRTLLARALATEPALLVLDEPFEGLDANARAVLAEILEGLAEATVYGRPRDASGTVPNPGSFGPVLKLGSTVPSLGSSVPSVPIPTSSVPVDPFHRSTVPIYGLGSPVLMPILGSSVPLPGSPILVLVADRWERIPQAINRVVELAGRAIAFSGERAAWETLLASRIFESDRKAAEEKPALLDSLAAAEDEAESLGASATARTTLDATATASADASTVPGTAKAGAALSTANSSTVPEATWAADATRLGDSAREFAAVSGESLPAEVFVELRDVTVGWSGRKVLDGLSWTVRRGEHWLVRGPNGSGKTTLLELITGDNPQAFSNDVRLFGRRRGSGETVWEIKARMGIVSYRLHLEYRYLDDSSLEEVLVSGLHDSIGLYREAGDAQIRLARHWLELSGFGGRGKERFGRLSFGEQRALLVARAAIKSPELLVLDEPCHGLDTGHRRRILDLLGAIADHGRSTLLHVTHDPAEVLSCEKRILELRPGEKPSWTIIATPQQTIPNGEESK